jgi:hypothetical protein
MARRYYPVLEQLDSVQSDSPVLFEVQRSFLSVLSLGFPFLIFTVLVIIANVFFADLRFPESVPVLKYFSVRWLAVIPAFFLAEMLRRYHNDLYIFGRHRATHLEGRLALNYSVPVIKYSDIRGITVDKDIPGRIFNYGDVLLGTAAHDNVELTISGVRAPYELASLIDHMRCRSRELLVLQESSPEFAEKVRQEEALEEEMARNAASKRAV